MKRTLRWGWTILLAAGLLGGFARSGRCEDRGWYVCGGGGIAGLDVTKGVTADPELGFRLAASGGFQFNRYLGLELDTGYIRNTIVRQRGQRREEREFVQAPVVVGGLLSLANRSRFVPFAGAGLGVIYVQMGDSDGGDVALGFKSGIRYGINERLGVGVDYTFFMLGVASAFLEEAVGADTGNLTVRWMF